jgi:putative transposase
MAQPRSGKRGRKPLPHDDLLQEVREIIDERASYGYRRTCGILRRRRRQRGESGPNHKRVYRVMKTHNLLLQRSTGGGIDRRHDGTIAVAESNLRWCSDALAIPCHNGEAVEMAFALDCCDREANAWIATSASIAGEHIRDLMLGSIEKRFNGEPPDRAIEWLTDNGSPYTARDTRSFAKVINLNPRRTPVRSPQSNGMAEAFVKTIKRDYVAVYGAPDADAVLRNLPRWIEDYNEHHPHKALRYQSPREFRRSQLSGTT